MFVLTHRAPQTPVPDVTFVGDLDSGLAAAGAGVGDKHVNVLGAPGVSETRSWNC
ncbi:MAG: hypothetical protein ACYC66_16845 [Chloroflexota bacterium]